MTDWRPSATTRVLAARARLLAEIRSFFAERGVLEVETPMASSAGNSDPGIEPFVLAGPEPRWLRTSPEYAMKRMLAHGCPDLFELGRVFRAGESGRWHNPEFTLLEWYRRDWDHRRLMIETAELVHVCGAAFGRAWNSRELSYRECFRRHAGIDPWTADTAALCAHAARLGIQVQGEPPQDRDAWLDLLLSHAVQPRLPAGELTLVHDYPASQAALARIRPGDPPVAERFELFVGPVELANGYHELADAAEQRMRFEAENRKRRAGGLAEATLDHRLLAALETGLPDCAGVALGVDRLLMACLGAGHIDDVIAFPVARA